MGRKLRLSSLFFFRIRDAPKSLASFSSSSFPSSRGWPCCILPKTQSFRAAAVADDIFKTVNSIYFDSHDSFLTFSEEEAKSFTATSASSDFSGECCNSVGNVIQRLRTDRLFFEPGETSASIMVKSEASGGGGALFKQSIAMTVDSEDPSRDFRVSMEEMVAANGVKEWEKLVELFVWFLRANGKENHGFIFGAFLELLVGLAASSSSSSCSSSSSSFVSRSLEIEELQEESEFC